MTIGERIKARRKELGITQVELAHRLGLKSKSTVCKMETSNDNPTMDSVKEYADALETTVAHLMGWDDVIPPDYSKHSDMATNLINNQELEQMLTAFDSLKDEDKKIVFSLINSLVNK